jgi:hypothetical protein
MRLWSIGTVAFLVLSWWWGQISNLCHWKWNVGVASFCFSDCLFSSNNRPQEPKLHSISYLCVFDGSIVSIDCQVSWTTPAYHFLWVFWSFKLSSHDDFLDWIPLGPKMPVFNPFRLRHTAIRNDMSGVHFYPIKSWSWSRTLGCLRLIAGRRSYYIVYKIKFSFIFFCPPPAESAWRTSKKYQLSVRHPSDLSRVHVL